MSVTLSLFAGVGAQFLDNNGAILSSGLIYTYTAGTTTPLTTYTTNLGTVAQPNPIVLDSAGRIPGGELWLTTGYGYKFVTKDSNGVLIGTYDNVPSSAQPPIINDASSISYEQGTSTTAGSFIVGVTYLITFLGTTNFQTIGASANQIGILFIATGVGSGTGTAQRSETVEAKLRQTVSIVDFGAVGNGTTDDTLAIQSAINTGKNVYVPQASVSYLVTGLTINTQSQTIYGDGGNSLFKLANGSNKSLVTVSASYVTLRNLGMDCNKANQSTIVDSFGSGVWTTGVSNLTVSNCNIFNPIRNGIASSFSNQNCLYENNKISNAGFTGIYNVNSSFPLSNSIITGNTIVSPVQDGIGTPGIQDCTISNNIIITPGVAAIALESYSTNTVISGNTIKGTGLTDTSNGIQLNDGYNITVIGNSVNGCGYGTVSSGTNTVTNSVSIIGNTYYQCGNNDAAIEIQGGFITSASYLNCYNIGATVSGNSIYNSPNAGILVTAMSNVSVIGNSINNFATSATSVSLNRQLGAIVLREFACYNTISNNTIYDSIGSTLKAGIIEVNDGDNPPAQNIISYNIIRNLLQDICVSFSGQNQSNVVRGLNSNVIPTTFTWSPGQILYATFGVAGGDIGWVSVDSRGGSFGSFSTTGTMVSGSQNIILSSTDGIFEGMFISIVNGASPSAPLNTVIVQIDRITKIVIVQDFCGNSVSGTSVTLHNPTFKTWGAISA